MTHSVRIDTTPDGYRWVCACKAQGNVHDEHQLAMEFGIQHLNIEVTA